MEAVVSKGIRFSADGLFSIWTPCSFGLLPNVSCVSWVHCTSAFSVTHLSKSTFLPAKLSVFPFISFLHILSNSNWKWLMLVVYFRAGCFLITFLFSLGVWGCSAMGTKGKFGDFHGSLAWWEQISYEPCFQMALPNVFIQLFLLSTFCFSLC